MFPCLALMLALSTQLLSSPMPTGTPESDDSCVGRPILAVDILAPASEKAPALLSLIGIRPGFLLSRAEVQQAIERLWALERFSQIEARVKPTYGSVELTFMLTPKRTLGSLHIGSVKGLNKDALQSALRLNPGEEVDEQTDSDLTARAHKFLTRHGYPLAQVQVTQKIEADGATVHVALSVQLGPANRVAQVLLHTDHVVPAGVLRGVMKTRLGEVLSQDVLEEDRTRLTEVLHAHGFLSSHIGPPTVQQRADGAVVDFHVKAGSRVLFYVVGAHALGHEELLRLWPSAVGGTSKQLLALYRQRLEAAYAKAGYYQPRVHVRMRVGRSRGMRRLDVHINEGPVLWVDTLRFKGAHALPRELLRQQVHAVLQQDLAEPSFFEPLGTGDWALRGAPQTPRPRAPHKVPAQNRYNAALYAQAADDIAAAYQDLGFADAMVTPPSMRPDRGESPNTTDAPSLTAIDGLALWPDNSDFWEVPPGRMNAGLRPLLQPGDVTFTVEEGAQRFVDAVSFEGNTAIDGPALLQCVQEAREGHSLMAPIMPGAPLSLAGIEDGRIAIVRKLRNAGFLYAKVFAQVDPPSAAGFANVRYTLEEGPAVHVERLLVRGNTHTREGIIRSRLSLAPGGLYKLSQAITDQHEMMALGVFSAVRVRLVDEEHPSENKDVVAEVEESERQLIEVAPGLSTTQGLRLRASYSHLNVFGTAGMFIASAKVNRQLFFDLYGSYADKLKTRFGAYRGIEQLTRALEREIRVGLRSPPIKLLRGDPLLRLDIVDQRINAVRYGLNSTSAILGADLTPMARVKMSLDVQAGVTELECPLGNDCDQDADVRRLRGGHPIQQGTLHTIKFGPTLHVEGRDDPISPSRGYHAFGRVYQAFGAAQGTGAQSPSVPFAFLKWEGNASTYIRLFGQILALSGRVGSILMERSSVPVDERFFLGGRDTLRGFVETTLIPQDACVVQDTNAPAPPHCAETIAANPAPPLSLGGNTYVLFKTELRMPLRDRFSLDVFCDVGNLWVNLRRAQGFHLRVGTGAGLRYATPVGALTVDFGINTAARAINHEPGYQVHFSIGSF